MRAVVLATLATLVGLALAATPAHAQNAWLASKMIEGMCGAKAAPGGSVDRLAERLNLTDAQKATLKDLKAPLPRAPLRPGRRCAT
jgi:Spy/CpxP family protein refolding chaperone